MDIKLKIEEKPINITLQSTQAINGIDGKSAYEIAVLSGFVGTEIDWLNSLKGEPGTTDYNELDNVPDEFAPSAHTHPISDITDFQTAVSSNTDVSANTTARHNAVTLAGTPNYITLVGQVLTRALINLASHVTGRLPFANFETGTARSVVGRAGSGNGDVGNISAGNDTILSRSGSGDVAFNNASTTKTILALNNVDNTSDATKNSAVSTLTNKTIDGGNNTLQNIPQSAVTDLTTDLSGKQATLVSGTNIKTINGDSILGSGNLTISGGGTPKHRTTIPGEIIADTANYQGLYRYNDTGATVTISNVAFVVARAAAGTGAACAFNVYKSSGTAADGLNTNAVALFTTAVNLGTGYTSLTNVPNTATVENGRRITVRATSSAGATRRASDAQIIISFA